MKIEIKKLNDEIKYLDDEILNLKEIMKETNSKLYLLNEYLSTLDKNPTTRI